MIGPQGNETSMALLDFGTPPPSLKAAGERRGSVALEVRAPLWLDGLGISYRLNHVDALQLREYARSRWVGPPARLVEQRLGQRLDLASAGQMRGKCLLRIDLTEFSQVFASPDDSSGLLQGRAFWLGPERQPLAERRLSISSPAATADARGGVTALKTAVDRLAEELLAWERELAAGGKIAVCQD